MLKESPFAAQAEAAPRRWFSDDRMDLIVWLDRSGAPTGFQLCYDKKGMERALTWKKNSGFQHEKIDSGEENPAKNRSPILVPDGVCPIDELAAQFQTASSGIDQNIRTFVLDKLREFAGR